jgi:glycosyltransferase involved in cell wall biosynthesis
MLHSAVGSAILGSPQMISLHLDTRPDWRGGQSQILLLLRGLRARGHEAELVALRGGPLEHRARVEGFRVHPIPPRLARAAGALLLRKLLETKRFDVVHAHDPHGLTAAWLARAHRRAALVVHRRVVNPLSRSPAALARYRAARRIFAISRFVADRVVAAGISPEQVAIIYDGVELPPASAVKERQQARQRWDVDGETLLGCVAQFVPGKNQEVLIRALPGVLKQIPNCRFLLVGDGPERAALEQLAQNLGVAPRVVFSGFIEDVAQAYEALDLFLFPAVNEGLGTSLLMAMAHGLPVVAVASGGVPEVVEDGSNGLLIGQPRAEEFSDAIVRLLKNPTQASRLGQAARETIARKFTADRMVKRTLEQYDELLRSSPRSG